GGAGGRGGGRGGGSRSASMSTVRVPSSSGSSVGSSVRTAAPSRTTSDWPCSSKSRSPSPTRRYHGGSSGRSGIVAGSCTSATALGPRPGAQQKATQAQDEQQQHSI